MVIITVNRLLGRKEDEDMDFITYVTDRKGHDQLDEEDCLHFDYQ